MCREPTPSNDREGYIRLLEVENGRLRKENDLLKERILSAQPIGLKRSEEEPMVVFLGAKGQRVVALNAIRFPELKPGEAVQALLLVEPKGE